MDEPRCTKKVKEKEGTELVNLHYPSEPCSDLEPETFQPNFNMGSKTCSTCERVWKLVFFAPQEADSKWAGELSSFSFGG